MRECTGFHILFGDKYCNNLDIINPEYEHVLWPNYDSRDKNLSKDFICKQNTCYPTLSEGVQSTSSQLIRLFGDKYHNNVDSSKPECDYMYTQGHNIKNERRLNIEPVQSNDQVDGKSQDEIMTFKVTGVMLIFLNATFLNNSQSIIEVTVAGKACIKRINVHKYSQ